MTPEPTALAEHIRLHEDARRSKGLNWKRWGPYLSERQWGTVREDYSPDGDCWNYFTHDQARSRAYRWGEDGILGITDRECRLCFSIAMWNGLDPILKERLFGLTGPQGNHGEDVKECYYFLESTPTHSYMKGLFKYSQHEYPYNRLIEENNRRTKLDPEFELLDTGIFDDNRYFDCQVEYAKNTPNDILIKLSITNRGPDAATLHLLPTLWFRNSWTWGCTHEGCDIKPWMRKIAPGKVEMEHVTLGKWFWEIEPFQKHDPELVFCENETNQQRCFGSQNSGRFFKDGINDYVVQGRKEAVNPKNNGTKASAVYILNIPAGQTVSVRLRLYAENESPKSSFGASFDQLFGQRAKECDDFYNAHIPANLSPEEHLVSRQAYAGILWSKQFYHYVVWDWLKGDPNMPKPPRSRKQGRNHDWGHLFNRDVISMPDSWEYPWYAAWDLSFHMITFARIDPYFAKEQLLLLLREWYMHPNGQLPAYEFAFNDVNPPVHAWACWRVYKMTGRPGKRDLDFLKRAFQKLLINFTWWVNRKDAEGKHIFGGGFLGLDNIGIFDRSKPLPGGGTLEQADGTAWMAFYCGTMLSMALELSREDNSYEDIASKFFEHFAAIVNAINTLGGNGLWNEDDGFYYDQLHVDGATTPLRLRSLVGVVPLFACEILEQDLIDKLPGFKKRMQWFLKHQGYLAKHLTAKKRPTSNGDDSWELLLAIPPKDRLERVLKYVLDENEFLSPHGIRSLSYKYKDSPYVFTTNGQQFRADYEPGESTTNLFGGNSNWRGPIWFPLNFLLVEALQRYHHFYGDDFQIEFPTGSGKQMNLSQVAHELNRRLANLFLPGSDHRRPCHADDKRYADDPAWRDLVLFYEYFHGDNGRGCGASHQTGWTALVTKCLEDIATNHSRKLANALMPAKQDVMPKVSTATMQKQAAQVGAGQPT
ncbi:MAG TPA: hypothetical protein VHS31_13865 [Tepidisphaeraceae bacterium]|jgi:hypothetical protein|nr:hypothetical protein [Tepidisphaeraceae bacterium]